MQIDPQTCAHFREIERALRTVRFVDEPFLIPNGADASDSSDSEPEAGPSRLPYLHKPRAPTSQPALAPLPAVQSGRTAVAPMIAPPAAAAQVPPHRDDAWAPPVPPRPHLYVNAVPGPSVPSIPYRHVPMVRPVPQAARRPIQSPTQTMTAPATAQGSTPAGTQLRPLPMMPQPGQLAEAATHVLQPGPPAPLPDRLRGRLQATLDALLPAHRRYKNDSLELAAWLRDNGVVALNHAGQDWVLNPHNASSDRLERLGIRQAFPNLSQRHVAALRAALAERYAKQLGAGWEQHGDEEGLTQIVREALPKAGRR